MKKISEMNKNDLFNNALSSIEALMSNDEMKHEYVKLAGARLEILDIWNNQLQGSD